MSGGRIVELLTDVLMASGARQVWINGEVISPDALEIAAAMRGDD